MGEADPPDAVGLQNFQELSDTSATQMVMLLCQNFKIKQAMDLLGGVWNKIITAAIRHGWPLLHQQKAELAIQETSVEAAVCKADIPAFMDQDKEQTIEVMREDKDVNKDDAKTEAPPSKKPSTEDIADILAMLANCKERLESSIFDTQEEALLLLQKVKTVIDEKYHTKLLRNQQSLSTCVLRRQNDGREAVRQAFNYTDSDVGDMTVELHPLEEVDFEGSDKTEKEAIRTRKEAKGHGNDEGKVGCMVKDGLL